MDQKPKSVLIVEDEKPLARALELKVEHCGFTAKSVFNGKEAMDLLSKEKFDLILLDLIMPVMDGFEVLQKMKEQNLKIPVIVLTNLGQTEDAKKAKELGAVDYFIKSNTAIADVIKHIDTVLGTKST